jgi:hypothetical protein
MLLPLPLSGPDIVILTVVGTTDIVSAVVGIAHRVDTVVVIVIVIVIVVALVLAYHQV